MSERAKRGDAAALAALRKADPVIAVMIDANPDFDPDGWLRLLPKMDEFGVLIFQVAGQQLSVAVTRTMLNRLTDQFGGKLPTPRQVLAADPESIRAAATWCSPATSRSARPSSRPTRSTTSPASPRCWRSPSPGAPTAASP